MRVRLVSSIPHISGVKANTAPSRAAWASATSRSRALSAGSIPVVVWMIAVRIMRRSPSGREERVKHASRIERGKIVGSAYMALIDKHLRHCCLALGALKHPGPLRHAEGDEIGRAHV